MGDNFHHLMSSVRKKRPANSNGGITSITPQESESSRRRINYEEMTPPWLLTRTPDDDENEDDDANEPDEPETTSEKHDDSHEDTSLFIVSPFGLCCCHPNCTRRQIVATDRSVRDHLRSHEVRVSTDMVVKVLERFEEETRNARIMQSMETYRMDDKSYLCFTCGCGKKFNRRDNAVAHCNKPTNRCEIVHITTESAIKLRCGRIVTDSQVDEFLFAFISKKLRNYKDVQDFLSVFLPDREKGDNSYTSMFYPLFQGCPDQARPEGYSYCSQP